MGGLKIHYKLLIQEKLQNPLFNFFFVFFILKVMYFCRIFIV